MRVEETCYQGYHCWMFGYSSTPDAKSQRQQMAALKRLCRDQLGRSHGSLDVSMWASLHTHHGGLGIWTKQVVYIRDPHVAAQAILSFC